MLGIRLCDTGRAIKGFRASNKDVVVNIGFVCINNIIITTTLCICFPLRSCSAAQQELLITMLMITPLNNSSNPSPTCNDDISNLISSAQP
jgi:hypothetical protein